MPRNTTLARLTLAALVTFGAASFVAAPAAYAKAPKNNNDGSGKKGEMKEVSGTVSAISKSEITLLVDGDKTKIKVFIIDDKTQITGNVTKGSTATVTPGANGKAKAISASAS